MGLHVFHCSSAAWSAIKAPLHKHKHITVTDAFGTKYMSCIQQELLKVNMGLRVLHCLPAAWSAIKAPLSKHTHPLVQMQNMCFNSDCQIRWGLHVCHCSNTALVNIKAPLLVHIYELSRQIVEPLLSTQRSVLHILQKNIVCADMLMFCICLLLVPTFGAYFWSKDTHDLSHIYEKPD